MRTAPLLPLLLTSCASLMSGTTQPVTFTSDDPEARVVVTITTDRRARSQYRGRVPLTVSVPKSRSASVAFIRSDGHVAKFDLPSGPMDSWFFGNIFFGAIPGMLFDAVTGAATRWPDHVYFDAGSGAVEIDPTSVRGVDYEANQHEAKESERTTIPGPEREN